MAKAQTAPPPLENARKLRLSVLNVEIIALLKARGPLSIVDIQKDRGISLQLASYNVGRLKTLQLVEHAADAAGPSRGTWKLTDAGRKAIAKP